MNLTHVFSRIVGAPLAIHPAKLDAILGGIGDRLGIQATHDQIEAAANSPKASDKKYAVQDGIAIIPVQGSLMKKTYGMMAESGCSSYETIGAQVEDAYTNPQVQGILLDIDSPGGEVSGLFELCDMLASVTEKPMYAVANDAAFSAAYAIASTADRLYVPITGGVGSIGVIATHLDQSESDKKIGLKYTFIHAGKKKADGNSHQPLSESAESDIQAEIDRMYGLFTSLVSKNRNMNLKDVVATQAGTYFGENAVKADLADKIGTLQDAFNDLKARIDGVTSFQAPKTVTKLETNINKVSAEARKLALASLLRNAGLEELKRMAKTANLDTDALIALLTAKKAEEDEEMGKECAEDKEAKKSKKASDDEEDDEKPSKKKKDEEDEDDEEDAKSKKATVDPVRIATLCKLAGVPEMASEFIISGATTAQVTEALLKYRTTNKAVKVSNSSQASSTPAELFRMKAAEIMNDDKPNKHVRFAQFMNSNLDTFRQYSKDGRKGAIRQ